jgi:hypothetical protein
MASLKSAAPQMRAFLGVSKLEIPLLDMLRKMCARKIDIDYMIVLL